MDARGGGRGEGRRVYLENGVGGAGSGKSDVITWKWRWIKG